MIDAVELVAGAVVVLILGAGVGPMLRCMTESQRPAPPKGMDSEVWSGIVNTGAGGAWIGWLERFFSFGIFWLGAYVALAAWLGFKVASKWESWSNVVQVPSTLPEVDDADYFRARRELGSWLINRFLIGTLLNVLIGLVGVALGTKAWDALAFVVSVMPQTAT